MGYKVNKRFVGTKQVRPTEEIFYVDFRNNTKANIESEGWTFSGTPTIDSNGAYLSSGQITVYRIIDTTKYKKVKFTATGYKRNNNTGGLAHWSANNTSTTGINGWLYGPRGIGMWYNDTNYFPYDTALSNGEYTWSTEIDYISGAITVTGSNSQVASGTLNSTYINALVDSGERMGIFIDSSTMYLYTLKIELYF